MVVVVTEASVVASCTTTSPVTRSPPLLLVSSAICPAFTALALRRFLMRRRTASLSSNSYLPSLISPIPSPVFPESLVYSFSYHCRIHIPA